MSERRGLSLFEVVISLAIFMGAIAAIGQLISTGARGAVSAKLQTQAVIRCETTLGEILGGYMSLQSTSGTYKDDTRWSYNVSVAPAQQQGLYIVEITASHDGQSSMSKVSYTLRRLVRDPGLAIQGYEKQLALDEAKAAAAAASPSSNTSSSTSSGGSR
ncbi:MAG: hypothetical protein HY290_23575 [Planctomycetia bacterium]|nr:hypothetical protein [Planctomycetia bacterium]